MVIDRRRFVRTTAAAGGGFLFCRCQLGETAAASALQPAAARRQVVIGGRRVRRILAAHGGGFLPSYIGRFENCHDLQAACQKMKKAPLDYLRGPQLYFDSLVYRPQNVRHLVDVAGAGQIVVGTDFGFDIASTTPVDTVLQTPGLSPEEQMAILGGNAARLLKLPV